MSRPPNYSSSVRRDDPFWLVGDDQQSTTREPAKSPTLTPAAPKSWFSKYGGTLAKGIGDVAAPWIEKALPSEFVATKPTAPQLPTPKKTSVWPYIAVGAGALGLVGLLAVAFGHKGKRR